ncbi:MAG: hypothetical protein IRZ33_11385 [Alicyclobacillaceae bacterium]|nr:hypothetical protein [Alicyclobacillaceae bacterium]
MVGMYEFHERERRAEMEVAGKYQYRTLAELTDGSVPKGVLSQLAKLVRQEVERTMWEGREPSWLLVSEEIVPRVQERIGAWSVASSKTARFAAEHPKECQTAIELLAERVVSLYKVACGCFMETAFAVAVVYHELQKELYGIVVPALRQALNSDRVRQARDEEMMEMVREAFRKALAERMDKRLITLADLPQDRPQFHRRHA